MRGRKGGPLTEDGQDGLAKVSLLYLFIYIYCIIKLSTENCDKSGTRYQTEIQTLKICCSILAFTSRL